MAGLSRESESDGSLRRVPTSVNHRKYADTKQDKSVDDNHPYGILDRPQNKKWTGRETQEQTWFTEDEDNSMSKSLGQKTLTTSDKIGKTAIYLSIIAFIAEVGVAIILACLWLLDASNKAWHAIMHPSHLIRIIAILGEVLKTAMVYQLGLAAGMLAAIRLESFQVLLGDAASVSLARGTTGVSVGKIYKLLKKQTTRKWKHGVGTSFSLARLCILSTFLFSTKAITFLLLRDIKLGVIPGTTAHAATRYGYSYVLVNGSDGSPATENLVTRSTWTMRPDFYPAFGEYSEPPVQQQGVSDTGLTLRAFLPLPIQSDRNTLVTYRGKTTVLDSRVTCQVPRLVDHRATLGADAKSIIIVGKASASRMTPRLNNSTLLSTGDAIAARGNAIPFSCISPLRPNSAFFPIDTDPENQQWRTSLCQLPGGNQGQFSGGIISEFVSITRAMQLVEANTLSPQNWGTAYLVLNVTEGQGRDWIEQSVSDNSSRLMLEASEKGEWLQMQVDGTDLKIGISLCYTAFMTSDIPVHLSSTNNRTEPQTPFDFKTRRMIYDQVRSMFGQNSRKHLSQRPILELAKQSSWIADQNDLPPTEPYIRNDANLPEPSGKGNTANYTAALWNADIQEDNPDTMTSNNVLVPDLSHIWLYQEIMQTNGTLCFALQSLITTLATMAYYSQLPQFDRIDTTSQISFYITTNIPQSWKGITITLIFVSLCVLLFLDTLRVFLAETQYTMLGNKWQMISQVVSSSTREILEDTMKSDDKIKQELKERGRASDRVGLDWCEREDQAILVVKKSGSEISAKRHTQQQQQREKKQKHQKGRNDQAMLQQKPQQQQPYHRLRRVDKSISLAV